MKELIAHGVKSIILTSGTLSPLSSFTMEMQIPFPVTLENPHVIQQHQVCVCTLKVGPDNFRLNSSYEHRFDSRYLTSLGNTIVNFSRIVPNGLLVFFPSYIVMDKSVEFWQQNNIWDRIIQYKLIFVEPTNKRAFIEAMDEFYEKVNDPAKNGAIFMAVCRGKVSEGLDFADSNGRAVMITGIPYPPLKDPKVILKKQFLDEMVRKGNKNILSGQKWYCQQATRAVNQAIGRVIRHKDDYGAIILCDERFARQDSIQQLPAWVRPYTNNFDNYGKAQGYLLKFFKTAESKLPAPQAKKKVTLSVSSHGAYFQPTTVHGDSNGGSSCYKQRVELARNVVCHGPNIQEKTEEISSLSNQYQQTNSSKSATSRPGLIQALEDTEGVGDGDSFTINQISKFGPQKSTFKKRKIVVKKAGENSDNTVGDSRQITQKHLTHAENYLEEIKQALSKEGYRTFSKALHEYKQNGDYTKVTVVLADLFTSCQTHFHLFRKFYRFVRAKHKQQFDQLCCDITGEGVGYKPEDSVSTKRLLTDISDGPQDKKAKVCDEQTTKIPSINENNVTVSVDKLLTSASHLSSLSTCQFSSTVTNKLSSNGNNTNSQFSPISSNFDNNEKLSQETAENLELILSSSNKAKTGYTCALCCCEAKVPFEAPCQHTCCIQCWRQVLDGNKLCPGCGIRIRRRHLIQRLFASGPNLSQK